MIPSDHEIDEVTSFQTAVNAAAGLAQLGHIVLFGITPSSPNTGYGYIRQGAPVEGSRAHSVRSISEKPDRATAETYLTSGDYFWNSGTFVFRAEP